MAKAKIFKIQGGGKTYFIPANGVKTIDEAAMSVGLSAGGYVGLTVYSKEGETAEEFVTRKGGTITEATMDIDYSRASIAEELPPATGKERYGAYEAPPDEPVAEDADTISYNNYLEYIEKHPSWPVPRDKNEWLLYRDYWDSIGDYLDAGFTVEQIEGYDRVVAYGEKYGDLEDDIPKNRADYLGNIDKYQLQLEKWIKEAGAEAAGFTDEQLRIWQDYIWHSRFRETGDSFFADVGDFFNNYDESVDQLGIWKKRAGEAEAERLKGEEYTQWSRERTKYAAQEAYGETPEYQPRLQQWLDEKLKESGAFEAFTERQYPSLASKFKLTQPELTGYPTREEARAEKARREQAFQAWLPGQVPGLEQKFWAQRPAERGERLYMQSPNVRGLNW